MILLLCGVAVFGSAIFAESAYAQDWTEFGHGEHGPPPLQPDDVDPSLTPAQIEREVGPDAWKWDIPIVDVATTLIFWRSTNYLAERAIDAFPESSDSVKTALEHFHDAFGICAEELLSTAIVRHPTFVEETDAIFMQSKPELDAIAIDEQVKVNIAESLFGYSSGHIKTPYLETLLSFHPQYRAFPEDEINDGLGVVFSTEDHPKSQGLRLSITYPASWMTKEMDQPSLIQGIQSKGGYGQTSVLITVRSKQEWGQKTVRAEDLEEVLKPRAVVSALPNATYLGHDLTECAGYPAIRCEYFADTPTRLNHRMLARAYSMCVKEYYIMITFIQLGAVPPGYPVPSDEEIRKRFEHHEKLFELMLDSIEISE